MLIAFCLSFIHLFDHCSVKNLKFCIGIVLYKKPLTTFKLQRDIFAYMVLELEVSVILSLVDQPWVHVLPDVKFLTWLVTGKPLVTLTLGVKELCKCVVWELLISSIGVNCSTKLLSLFVDVCGHLSTERVSVFLIVILVII